jgi:hypothetical protein
MSPSTPGEIPTVKAEGSYKQRPEQPGGIDIPHQDVQVYHEIDGSAEAANAKPEVEHMLPPPEEPNASAFAAAVPPVVSGSAAKLPARVESLTQTTVAPVPAPAPTPSPAIAPSPAAVPAPAVTANAPLSLVPSPPAVATTVASAAPKPADVSAPVSAPTPAVAAVQPAAPAVAANPAPLSPAGKGKAVVQLAALPDERAAQAMAQKLQAKYGAILGQARLRPVRADLGAKGIFYRIQSQALSDEQAKAICAAIKNLNAGCLLVRP